MNVCLVKRSGEQVHFERGGYGLKEIRSIKDQIPEGTPVVLSLSGWGLIHRIIDGDQIGKGGDLLRQILPSARREDFYVQHSQLDSVSVLSIGRIEAVDRVCKQLEGYGFPVLGLVFGPFAVTFFRGFLLAPSVTDFRIARHRFIVADGRIGNYEFLPSDVDVGLAGKRFDLGGEQLDERLIVAFATAFGFISELDLDTVDLQECDHKASEYRWHWQFKRTAVILTGLIIFILLANALFFIQYSGKVADFSGNDPRTIEGEIVELEKQRAERDALLKGLGQSESTHWGMAYLADHIATTIPAGIGLTELQIYPLDITETRKQKRPVRRSDVIQIIGHCTALPEFNEWVGGLRKLHFCSEVYMETYEFDERNEQGVFTVLLKLKL
ncbi:hypothetical protein [Parapedobacter sp. 10938]|uniref:hypothetical protein n=1 Tax=Parapedobacter flavus TaxID=3110225 RepID=UPI002DBEC1CE|nr:hypothetical protein [Parapedobacter sp. 10938]MEC3882004.1 hypothetical protein [Parapedobacter sp. 10938]